MMIPALYHWKHMLRDYARLLSDDKWQWCSQCRRPVEHIAVSPDGDGAEELMCMDCGFCEPEAMKTFYWPPAAGL